MCVTSCGPLATVKLNNWVYGYENTDVIETIGPLGLRGTLEKLFSIPYMLVLTGEVG